MPCYYSSKYLKFGLKVEAAVIVLIPEEEAKSSTQIDVNMRGLGQHELFSARAQLLVVSLKIGQQLATRAKGGRHEALTDAISIVGNLRGLHGLQVGCQSVRVEFVASPAAKAVAKGQTAFGPTFAAAAQVRGQLTHHILGPWAGEQMDEQKVGQNSIHHHGPIIQAEINS